VNFGWVSRQPSRALAGFLPFPFEAFLSRRQISFVIIYKSEHTDYEFFWKHFSCGADGSG